MFSVQEGNIWTEIGSDDTVKCTPISCMHYIGTRFPYNAAKLDYSANTVSGPFIQLVDSNRLLQALDELACRREEAQLMFQVRRRSIDDVDDTVLQTSVCEGMQNMQNLCRAWF